MTTLAWLQFGITMLPKITVGVGQFVEWLHSLRQSLQQSGEWDIETREAFRAALLAKGIEDWERED